MAHLRVKEGTYSELHSCLTGIKQTVLGRENVLLLCLYTYLGKEQMHLLAGQQIVKKQ